MQEGIPGQARDDNAGGDPGAEAGMTMQEEIPGQARDDKGEARDGCFYYFVGMRNFLLIGILLALVGCSESTDRIENKLTPYLQEDLKFMVAETMRTSNNDREAILDTPYYRVKDFRLFEGAESRIYAAYAEVDFFIFKDIAMHEKRKYRYDVHGRHWDRYLKTLKFGKDTVP